MKKLLSFSLMALMVLSVMPAVLAVSVGTGVTPIIETEDFEPIVWMCGEESVWADDSVEPQLYGLPRFNNYAFEGESIIWTVLVMDKNGVEKISDVYATIGDVQGEGNEIEVNCIRTGEVIEDPHAECEAQILEEDVEWNGDLMAVYECRLTVETPDSMYGEFWATVEAEDYDGLLGTMAQNEYWFFNPVIALTLEGDMSFEEVRPGQRAYSDTMLLGNDADDSSGVILDMYISGTDFYDSTSSGAMCPTSNVLALNAFTYDVTNGQFNEDDRAILYGDTIAQAGRIMDEQQFGTMWANPTNFLAPGAEMSITFQLDLPEPCNGDFDTGSIYFWGEAI